MFNVSTLETEGLKDSQSDGRREEEKMRGKLWLKGREEDVEETMAVKNRDGVKERWLRTDRERVRGKG